MTEENNVHVLQPENWGRVTQLIRQNQGYLIFLNEINARFDKPIFLDDKDWLQTIFSTLFNFTWQNDGEEVIIISHHAFSEPGLTRIDSSSKLRVYFYTLPYVKNDKLKESYEKALKKIFPQYDNIEGVQIYGSNHTQETKPKFNGKSTRTVITREKESSIIDSSTNKGNDIHEDRISGQTNKSI